MFNLFPHKTENTSTSVPVARAQPASTSIENPPTKAGNAGRPDAAHRQPLGNVGNQAQAQAHEHHRPAEVEGPKPAKSARTEDTTVLSAAPAPAPASASAQLRTAAHAPSVVEIKPVMTAPVWIPHPMPDLDARRKELGACPNDIDSADLSDPMFCSTYVQEIYDYLRQKEVEDQIVADYMSRQPNITPRMRMVLVDWMVEVQLKFRMTSESLYLSVNIVDKYLQKKTITREELQLLGVTALHIASKFEEVYSVDINDFVFICDHACTAAGIIAFEGEVLRTIGWCLTTPCPLHFLRRYSKAAGSDGVRHTMSKYLTELSLGSYEMLRYLPSTQAAAAVLLTRHLMGTAPYWSDSVLYHCCYYESEILSCARLMLHLILHPDPKFRLVTRKYSGNKFCCVARIAADNAPKVNLDHH